MGRDDLTDICISSADRLRDAIACMNRNEKGIVLVIDASSRLVATLTDGDVRRAVLSGCAIDSPVGALLSARTGPSGRHPVTVLEGTSRADMLRTMKVHCVQQLPVLDAQGMVRGLVTLRDLVPEDLPPLRAVIMAGGAGLRLRPLTKDTPKPMLPVGKRPIMEHIVERLREAGVTEVKVSTHYKPDKIREHFGDGRDFGVAIDYIAEDRPLGTAGALGLMARPAQTMLVVNGDILSGVNYRGMHAFHREHASAMTVGVRRYDLEVPYGVLDCSGPLVQGVVEKPSYSFLVNAGIYLIEPAAHDCIPHGQHFDMTDLIRLLVRRGLPVVSFPIVEYWLDIGQHGDYAKAQEDVRTEGVEP